MKKFVALSFLFLVAFAALASSQISRPAVPHLGRKAIAVPEVLGAIACTFKGQSYYNTTTDRYRICTATGTPGTWTDSSALVVGTTPSNGTAQTLLKTNISGVVADATGLTSTSSRMLTATSTATSSVPVTVQLAASQTGNAFEVLPSGSSTPLMRVNAGGQVLGKSTFSSTAPAFAFEDDATIGLTKSGNSLFFVQNGTSIKFGFFGAYELGVSNIHQIGWAPGDAAAANIDTGFARQAAGVIRVSDGSTGVRGFLGGGGAVASAAALPVPTGNVFHVTGTTNITSITSTNFQAGVCITLIFDGVLTFTDGSNLKLAGNFVTTADDTISLCYDGTNWFETGRAVN